MTLNMAEPSKSNLELHGIPAAPGKALGPVLMYRRASASTASVRLPGTEAVESEQSRVVVALAAAQTELEQLAIEVEKTLGPSEGAIFTAQSLMAADPMVLERAN